MSDNKYSGPAEVGGMVDFLHTLEEEVCVSSSAEEYTLSGDVESDTAAEYLQRIMEGEAEGSATPWDDFEGNGLLDPESLEPWGDSNIGRIQLQSQELTEDGVSGAFDYNAIDGEGEEYGIKVVVEEESYDGSNSDVFGNARMSKAFEEVGL